MSSFLQGFATRETGIAFLSRINLGSKRGNIMSGELFRALDIILKLSEWVNLDHLSIKQG